MASAVAKADNDLFSVSSYRRYRESVSVSLQTRMSMPACLPSGTAPQILSSLPSHAVVPPFSDVSEKNAN